MSDSGEGEEKDTERAVVTTYVPEYQKKKWENHAEEMDMSLSEFMRTMTQAGRRGFGAEGGVSDAEEAVSGESSGAQRDDMREEILSIIKSADSPPDKQRLIEELQGEFEERFNSIMGDLQSENRVKYDMGAEGFVLDE